jgi:hypothetical protein
MHNAVSVSEFVASDVMDPFYLQSAQYIQQIVYKRIQWHVEECSVALLRNSYVQGLLWLTGIRLTNRALKTRPTNTTITLGIW